MEKIPFFLSEVEISLPPMLCINAFPGWWHFLWFWASVFMDLSWGWENWSPLLIGLPSFSCKKQDLSRVEGKMSMDAQSLKKYIGCSEKVQEEFRSGPNFEAISCVGNGLGKKRNPGSFRGALDLYLNSASLAFPYVTAIFLVLRMMYYV